MECLAALAATTAAPIPVIDGIGATNWQIFE
jgi:hypothetical protein